MFVVLHYYFFQHYNELVTVDLTFFCYILISGVVKIQQKPRGEDSPT